MPKPLHEDPIPFITLPNWVKAAARCGFNIQPIFKELGIPTDLVHLESATVARPLLVQAMRVCVAQSRQQHFPFALGETFAFEYLADLETFVTTSPTLREAMKIFEWVRELINPMIHVTLVEQGKDARLILRSPGEDEGPKAREATRWFTETTFAAIVRFGRLLMGDHGDYRELQMKGAPPRYAAEYRRYFKLPVRFSARENALVIDRSLMDVPLQGAFPSLHEQAQYRVEQRLQKLPSRTGLVAAIEDILQRQTRLLGRGVDAVAAELKLHPRTLQRRLKDTGDQFADLQARVQYRLAMQWLDQRGDTRISLEDISERLGFSDRRSFTRAFTRWSGVSPSQFRQRGLKASNSHS